MNKVKFMYANKLLKFILDKRNNFFKMFFETRTNICSLIYVLNNNKRLNLNIIDFFVRSVELEFHLMKELVKTVLNHLLGYLH